MSQDSSARTAKPPAGKVVRDIRRATRNHHSAEDKIRIVLEGLRGEESIAARCRRDPMLAAPIRRRRTSLVLLQHPDDLLLHEPRSLHHPSPFDGL